MMDVKQKDAMMMLGQMGYTDFNKNQDLCRRYNNDINQVLNALMI
jgi:hypothetical protein